MKATYIESDAVSLYRAQCSEYNISHKNKSHRTICMAQFKKSNQSELNQ